MAEQKSRLVIEISTENAKRNAQALGRELKSIEKNGTYASKSMDSLSISARTLATQMAGIVTVGAAISKMDMFSNLQNRLKLVTQSQTELNRAMNDTFTIAQKSYASWDSVVQVYQRFSDNAKRLKIDMTQTAALTETVSKAVAISGASTQAAEAALTQFGQALASGVLRGEELNSVMEQTPALAKAIAEGMGITVGQLRTVASEGKITSDVLVKALTKAKGSVDELFAKTDVTIGQSLTQLSNEVTKFTGEAGKGSGAASALASSIQLISNNFNTFASLGIAVTIGYITTALARKTAVLATSAITWSAETKAVIANNAAKSSSLVIGRSLLGALGGPVGLGVTVASVAAGYLLMKDNGDEVNEMLNKQSQYAGMAAGELTRLSGAQKKAAIDELSTEVDIQNNKLKAAKNAFEEVVESILDANKANQQAYRIWAEVRTGVTDVDSAYKKLNASDFVTNAQINQLTEAKKKVEVQENATRKANEELLQVKPSSEKARQGLSSLSSGAKEATAEITELDEKLAKFNTKKLEALYITQNAKGWGGDIEKAKALLEFRKELGLGATGRSLNADEQTRFKEYWKAIQDLSKYEEKITKEKRDQTKEAEKQLELSKKMNGFVGASALSGLRIKSGESIAGGKVRGYTANFAQLSQQALGSQLNRFTAFNDSYHKGTNSKHAVGNAFDFTIADPSKSAQVVAQLENLAKRYGFVIKVLDEYKKKSARATGGHLHVSVLGYKGSESGIDDAKSELEITQKVNDEIIKKTQERDQLKSEYLNADYRRQQDHEKKVADLKAHGLNDLVAKENAQYKAETELSRLQLDAKLNAYKWTEEQKIEYAYQNNLLRLDAEGQYSEEVKAKAKASYKELHDYELSAYKRLQQDKLNAFKWGLEQQTGELQRALIEAQAQLYLTPSQTAKWQLQNEYSSSVGGAWDNYQNSIKDINKKDDNDQYINDAQTRHQMLLAAEQQYQNQLKLIKEKGVSDDLILLQKQQSSTMAGYANMFGGITSLMQGFGDNSSTTYRTMFALQKAFALSSAFLNSKQAILDAYAKENGNILMKMAAAAKAAIQTGVMTAAIQAITPQGFSGGGLFNGSGHVRGNGTETSDSINARLSDYEYVTRAWAVKRIGVENMEYMNRTGEIPFQREYEALKMHVLMSNKDNPVSHFSHGGAFGGGVVEALRKGQRGYSDGGVVHDTSSYIVDRYKKITEKKSEDKISIQVNVTDSGVSTQSSNSDKKQLGDAIGNAVRAVIRQEQRQGGMLAK